MTFTLLACETPPSSYEAEPAVRVGRSVNSLIRVRLALVYIGGQVRLKFDGKYKWLTESARAQTRPARPLATGLISHGEALTLRRKSSELQCGS